jgi:D-arabinose 1-dehydrogenase-like Zn-dependent alcohol dehydrogenase
VIVRVAACGVCYRDIVERRGGFAFQKRPVVPGHEFAGEVVALGEGVTDVAIGQRVVNLHRAPCGSCEACTSGHETRCRRAFEVFGLSIDGAYAEHVLAPTGCLVPLPDAIGFEQACFLNCTAAVSLRALRTAAALREGEDVLVTGASGGVGLHAMQVAKALGARVLAATSSMAKAETLRRFGADEIVVAQDLAFHKSVKRMTGGRGVAVALDCVGAPTFNASLRSLAPGGRLIVLGNVDTERCELNAGYLILGELTVRGSAGSNRTDLEQVLRWVERGIVRPALAQTLPLAEAADAHRRLEERGAEGRLVLVP